MAANQSFLDGLRSQAGFGMNYTRPSASRSADQNSTISGNPGYSTNMPQLNYNQQQQPMSWQQQVMMRQQQQQQLAQDPTNINYIQPQPTGMNSFQTQVGGQMGGQGGGNPTLAQLQAARAAMQSPNAAQRNLMASNGGGMAGMGLQFGANQPGGPQQGMFTQPRPVMNGGPNGVQQMMGMGNGGPSRLGGAPIPRNLAAGPSGYRFVRPMAR